MTCWRSLAPIWSVALILEGGCSMQMAASIRPQGVAAQLLSPAPGETGVPEQTPIVVQLPQPIARSSVRSGGIALYDQAGRAVPGSADLDDPTTAVFEPEAPLTPGTTYRVCLQGLRTTTGASVTRYVLDQELGAELPLEESCYTFSTASHLAVRFVLASETEHLSRVYLSEPCDQASLSDLRVLSCETGTPLEFRLRYAPAESRLTIALPEDAGPLSDCCLVLPRGLKTQSGTPLAECLVISLGDVP